MSKTAKAVYRPIGLIGSLVASSIAATLFQVVWKKVTRRDDAPTAMQSEYRLREILLASAVRGAIVAVVKALVSRGGARGFTKLTGAWPGD
ncbi:DUF4235 domain-containing protein [Modestobacter muralis]|uniref:DUF4235 domain-containing protein n=1 Tax=Modestobacter muralis TaxID=1608614 RepID=A0A6P0ETS1_9ACTN|nr:DUF4235 domain-containing protein [Modestobacter muralis]NEK94076.1 DUF4235 domain-containing protein [Modestobacter muralis]NEN50843.1 DUF4235 domain-containing protein [Modestobacter muralis]